MDPRNSASKRFLLNQEICIRCEHLPRAPPIRGSTAAILPVNHIVLGLMEPHVSNRRFLSSHHNIGPCLGIHALRKSLAWQIFDVAC